MVGRHSSPDGHALGCVLGHTTGTPRWRRRLSGPEARACIRYPRVKSQKADQHKAKAKSQSEASINQLKPGFGFTQPQNPVKYMVLGLTKHKNIGKSKVLALSEPQNLVKYMVLALSKHKNIGKYTVLAFKSLRKLVKCMVLALSGPQNIVNCTACAFTKPQKPWKINGFDASYMGFAFTLWLYS